MQVCGEQLKNLGTLMAPPSVGGAMPTSPLQFRRMDSKFDKAVAKAFIKLHHYSGKMPTGKNVCFGWYTGEVLFAVAVYGISSTMRADKYWREKTTLLVTPDNLYELKRLARRGKVNDYSAPPLTQFLALCHRALRKDGIEFIVSFSDPDATSSGSATNHNGGIYAAANFFKLGTAGTERHFTDENGKFVHRRIPYRSMQRRNIALAEEKYAGELARLGEEERTILNAKGGKQYAAVTWEMQHRAAKKCLKADELCTFAIAQKTLKLKPKLTLAGDAKTRWFLPLTPAHRATLTSLQERGRLTISTKGELVTDFS